MKPTHAYFYESQRFSQGWLWLLLAGANGIVLWQWLETSSTEDGWVGLAALGLTLAVTLLLLVFKLETQITDQGVAVRFFPFHQSYKTNAFADLAEVYVRKYSPLGEFGGWGLRYSLSGKGKAYNVKGDQGLQLVLANGSKLLIGTQRPHELKAALEQAKAIKK